MFENSVNRTELGNLGEFGLIEWIEKSVQIHHPESIKGIGDDAAVIDPAGQMTIVTTDMLVEGVHFDLMFHPLKHLGYKAVVVNLSDVYAMNATPKQILVSIALSNRFSLEAVEELYEGMALACEHYKVDLVGGDTTSSTSGLVLSITAIGTAEKTRLYTEIPLKSMISSVYPAIWVAHTWVYRFWNVKRKFSWRIRKFSQTWVATITFWNDNWNRSTKKS